MNEHPQLQHSYGLFSHSMNFMRRQPHENSTKPPLPPPKSHVTANKPPETIKVSETTIRNVQALKRSVEQLRSENRELRQLRDSCIRQAQGDISASWQQKLENMRQKWHSDKEKTLASCSAQMQRKYEEKIKTMEKLNSKEISSLQLQLRNSQENMSGVSLERKLQQQRKQFDEQLHHIRVSTQRHVKSLLDELKTKERQIQRFEQSLAVIEQKQQATEENMPSTSLTRFIGGVQMMPKDEHEREKQRWNAKLQESQLQMKAADEAVSELNILKAELNKKIVELERQQKPTLDSNRLLTQRNKTIMTENKKLAEKVRHLQEDFNAIKTTHDRIVSENSKLKERRSSPEKMDELEELKQQNLDYARCITTLKQATIEKDRRLDILHKKIRSLKRSRTGDGDIDECRSVSDFSASSISLDTITEDGEENDFQKLSSQHMQLQRVHAQTVDRQRQLEHSLQQSHALGINAPEKLAFTSRMRAMHDKLEDMEKERDKLERELDESREEKELLEFQMLELQNCDDANPSIASSSTVDQSVSTSDDDGFASSLESSLIENAEDELPLDELKIRFTLLKHRRELRTEDKLVVSQVKKWLENLQAQHEQCRNKEIEREMHHKATEGGLRQEIEKIHKDYKLSEQDFIMKINQLGIELNEVNEEVKSIKEALVIAEGLTKTSDLSVCKLKEQLRLAEERSSNDRNQAINIKQKMVQLQNSRIEESDIVRHRDKDWSQQMHDCQNARDRLLDEKVALESQYSQNITKYNSLQKRFEEDIGSMENKLKDAMDAHIILQRRCDNMHDKKDCPAKISNDLESEIKYLNQQLIKVRDESQQNCKLVQHQNEQLEKCNKDNHSLRLRLNELEAIKDSYKNLQSQNAETEKMYFECKERFRESLRIIKEYEVMDRQYANRVTEANTRVAQLQKEILHLRTAGSSTSGEIQCLNIKQAEQISTYKRELAHANNYQKQLEQQFQLQLQMVGALKQQLTATVASSKNIDNKSSDASIALRIVSPMLSAVTGGECNWEERALRIERTLNELPLNDAHKPEDIRKLVHLLTHMLRVCAKYQKATHQTQVVHSNHEDHGDSGRQLTSQLSVTTAHVSIINRLIRQLKLSATHYTPNNAQNNCLADAIHDLEEHLRRVGVIPEVSIPLSLDSPESPDDRRSNSSASGPNSHSPCAPVENHSSFSDESSYSDGGLDVSLPVSNIKGHQMWRTQKRVKGFRRPSAIKNGGVDRRCLAPKPSNLHYKVNVNTNCIELVQWDLPMCVDIVTGYKLYVNGELCATVRDRSQSCIKLVRPVKVSPFVTICMTSVAKEGVESEPTYAVPRNLPGHMETSISLDRTMGTSEV